MLKVEHKGYEIAYNESDNYWYSKVNDINIRENSLSDAREKIERIIAPFTPIKCYNKITRSILMVTDVYRNLYDDGDNTFYIINNGEEDWYASCLVPINEQTENKINEIILLLDKVKPLHNRIKELEDSLPTLDTNITFNSNEE